MKRRGFSLVESLLAMGLVLALLGMISTLMREYTAVSRHMAARDNTFDGVQYALTEMAQELGSAVGFVTPFSSPATTLRFYRLNTSLERFPAIDTLPLNDDGQPLWDPRDNTHLWDIHYFKEPSTGALIREVTPSSDARQVMVAKIDSLLVTKVSEGYYQLQLSFLEDKRLRSSSRIGRVWCRL